MSINLHNSMFSAMQMEELLKSTNKRSEIVKSSLELFAEKGFDGTTINDIAKAAGITPGAIYRHFTSKEELGKVIFETLIGNYSGELAEILNKYAHIKERVEYTVHLTYTYYEKYPAAVCFALKSQHNFWENLSEGMIHPHLLFNRIISEGLEKGEIRSGTSVVLGGIFAGALIEPLTFLFYLVKEPVNFSEMADEVAGRIIKMLG